MRVAMLLAAGRSRRFGSGDKLLERLEGSPLVLHALACARNAGTHRLIVVVPNRGGRLGRLIGRQRDVTRVVAPRHREGLGASLAAGLAAVRPIEREVLLFLADMPRAAARRGLRLAGGINAARPTWRGQPGHPVLARASVAKATQASGERGWGKALAPLLLTGGHAGNILDLDTRSAFRRARYRFRSMT